MPRELLGRVEHIVEHAPDTRSLFLGLPAGEVFDFRPGQFISALLPVGGEILTRPYSLASSPEEERLEICLNLVAGGRGSPYLLGLPLGATIRFTGPWGTFTLDRAPQAEAVFIADGTGIAPIRPMLRRAVATAGSHALRLLQAVGPGEPQLYQDELSALTRSHPLLRIETVARATLAGEVRRRWVDADRDRSRHFWICGVGPIVPTLRDLLRGAGYERRAVQYEKW
jgi:CDP-4-dehydro-6-deoxyglucose reductase